MTNVSRTNRNGQRPATDLYQTPAGCTDALCDAMPDVFKPGAKFWEPACGKLAIAGTLERRGCKVVATDKYNHGCEHGGRDFFKEKRLLAPIIITNPPYGRPEGAGRTENIADDFIRYALSFGPQWAFFFLPLTFLAGVGRSDLLEHMGLARIYVFRDRLTLSPDHLSLKSGGVVSYAWFAWQRCHIGAPTVHRITSVRRAA